eukprot:GFKZ01002573.1.p1 GENE.GFKZ01002573.1~~GFKZ01002573.1.p1  ORF type:complete len:444 (-),score=90.40 GFKZ01002573.1:592-1923(-)
MLHSYNLLLAALSFLISIFPTHGTPISSHPQPSHPYTRHYYHTPYPHPQPHSRLRALDHPETMQSGTDNHYGTQRAALVPLRGLDPHRGGEVPARDVEGRGGEWKRTGSEREGGDERENSVAYGGENSVAEDIFQSIGRWFGFRKRGHQVERNGTRVGHEAHGKTERVNEERGVTEESRPGVISAEVGANEGVGAVEDWTERHEHEGEGGRRGGETTDGEGDGKDVWGGLSGQEREVGEKDIDTAPREGEEEKGGVEDGLAESGELSDADLLEMVRLFRRFFGGVERILSEGKVGKESGGRERGGLGGARRAGPGGGGGKGELNKASGRGKGKDELPDVAMALAEVDKLNRARDLERRKMRDEESVEGRERLKYMARTGVREVEEEEEAADFESERMVRELPKAAPSYGIRKRLLGRGEETSRVRGKQRSWRQWLLEGIQTIL